MSIDSGESRRVSSENVLGVKVFKLQLSQVGFIHFSFVNLLLTHLILEMSMNEAFIWLSGHRIIDREILNG